MKCLVFLAVLAVAHCAVVEVDKCSYGESYWCSSLKVAQDCGAFQHCMTTVWKNQEPKPVKDNTDVCQFCESLVDDVRKFIEDQKDQETMKKYLEAACAIIPDQGLADECKDMVDSYLDVLLELIASELDPQSVCSLMGLCNGGAFEDTAKHPVVHQPIQKPEGIGKEPICTDCKKFFQDLKDTMTSGATEKEIEQYIEDNLCAMMGSLQDYCNQMVEAYIPEILDLVMAEFDPTEMCAAMGFCNSTRASNTLLHRMRLQKSPLYISAQKLRNEETCVLCKTVINELQTLAKDTKTQAEVENFLKNNLCSHLGDLKDVCDQTIDQYLPVLFELLATELDADTLCQSLGLCDSSIDHTLRMSMPKKPQPKKNIEASAQCVLCEFIMKELDDELSQNATKQEIMDALNKVCDVLPDTLKQECDAFVKQYAPAIIAILEQEMNPQVVCTFLGLCKSSKQQGPLMAKPKVGDGEMCGTCETLIQYLDSMLEENSTVQEIEHLLEKICNFLPENIRQECDDIIETYGPAVIQLIAQFADPREVCTALGLCSSTKAMPQVVPMANLMASKPQQHLLGTKECTWGPSYWCDNMDNAVKCQAVEHCKKHIWKN